MNELEEYCNLTHLNKTNFEIKNKELVQKYGNY